MGLGREKNYFSLYAYKTVTFCSLDLTGFQNLLGLPFPKNKKFQLHEILLSTENLPAPLTRSVRNTTSPFSGCSIVVISSPCI